MSSRIGIQQIVSTTSPVDAAIGDEWFNPSTGKLYKRTALSTGVDWIEIPVSSYGSIQTTATVSILNTTNAVSPVTGALIVRGGVGISGNVSVGGVVTATNVYVGIWPVSTSTVSSGLANTSTTQVGYATTAGQVAQVLSTGTGIFGNSYNGSTAVTWSLNTATLMAIAVTATQVNTVAQTANAVYYPTFVDTHNSVANGMNVYTSNNLAINPSTGYVGVGTTATAARLHINYGNTPAGSAEALRLEVTGNAAGGRGPRIDFYAPAGSGTSSKAAAIGGLSGLLTFTDGSANELMRISTNNAGVVSIGSGGGNDWLAALKVLQAGASSAFVNSSSQTKIYSNYYSWNGGTTLISANGYYGDFGFDYSAGAFTFSNTATSGTAGAGATPIERVRIDSVGRLGVGTTAPASLLHVAGDVRVTGITTVTNTTAATSTTTGALIVVGGVGVGGNTYVGGNLTVGTTSSISSASIVAQLGPELMPAIVSGSWTLGTGWSISSGQLIKAAGQSSTAYPTTSIGAVAGTTYLVTIVVTASVLGNNYISAAVGGTTVSTLNPGTIVSYVTAQSNGSFVITDVSTAESITITSISVRALTANTGNLTVDGALAVRSLTSFVNPVSLGIGAPAIAPLSIMTQNSEALRIYRTNNTGQYLSFNEGDGSVHVIQAVGSKPFRIIGGSASGIEFWPNAVSAGQWDSNGNLIVSTTNGTTSSTTGALQIAGGAGIAGGLYVSGIVTATTFVGNFTGTASTATSAATAYSTIGTISTGTGILGSSFNGSANQTWSLNTSTLMAIAVTATSAATAYSWVGGTVTQPVTFSGPVVFNGTATYVFSTNTVYTDNILELHTTATGVNSAWTYDDGKDIGLRFHYFGAGADQNAALVLANDTKYLEWYGTGTEGASTFAGGASYGTFKTGNIVVTGVVTATTFFGAFSGSITGAASQVLTQSQTANATYYPTFVSANNASATGMSEYTTSSFTINPNTGLLSLAGSGLSLTQPTPITFANSQYIKDNGNGGLVMYSGAAININAAGTGALGGITLSPSASNYAPQSGALLSVNAGAYFNGIVTATTFVGNLTGTASTATSAGTAYATIGTHSTGTGILGSTFNGSANQTWSLNTATLMASAVTATSAATAYATIATISTGTGILGSAFNGSTNQTWSLNTSTLMTTAVTALSASGSAGSVANALTIGTGLSGTVGTYNGSAAVTVSLNTTTLIASAVTATSAAIAYSSIGTLTAGTGITGSTFNGSANQTWSLNTTTLMAVAVNLANGTAGQVVVQSGPNATTFINTGSLYVGRALAADSVTSASTATSAGTAYATIGTHTAGTGITGSTFNGSANQTWSLNTATLMASAVTATSAATAYATIATISTGTGILGSAFNGSTNQTWSLNTSTLMTTAVTALSASGSAGSVVNALTIGTGLSGTVGTYNGSAAVTVSLNTTTLIATAVNLANGTAGQVVVQSGPNATTFINTGSLYVGRALAADSATSASTATNAGTSYATIGTLSAGTGITGSTFNGSTNQTWSLNTTTLMASAVTATSAATAYSAIGTLTAGTGITGSTFNGSANQTWSLNTTTLMQTAVTALSASGSAGSVANALTIGTGLSGTVGTYNGSAAVTVSLNTATLMTTAVNHLGGSVNATTGVFGGITTVTNNTAATSTTTGALQVVGGVGIGGDAYVGGILNVGGTVIAAASGTSINGLTATFINVIINSTVNSSNTNTGALQVQGGASFDYNVVVGGTTSATSTITGALTVAGGVGVGGSIYAGNIYSNGSLVATGSASFAGGTVTGAAQFTNSTAVSSTNTGALTVTGGVGIGGGVFVGGVVTATNVYVGIWPVSTTTNMAYLPYVDAFTSAGTTTTFTLSTTPTSINYTTVVIDGVTQLKNGTVYTVTGTSVVFSEIPVSGSKIEVTTAAITSSGGGGGSGGVGASDVQTLTNKWIQPRVNASIANSATPTLNTDNYDMMIITGQSVPITSFTTNLSGTPVNGQKLWISITGTTAIPISWGAKFESSTAILPSTTVSTARLDIGFIWNVATGAWRCLGVA